MPFQSTPSFEGDFADWLVDHYLALETFQSTPSFEGDFAVEMAIKRVGTFYKFQSTPSFEGDFTCRISRHLLAVGLVSIHTLF